MRYFAITAVCAIVILQTSNSELLCQYHGYDTVKCDTVSKNGIRLASSLKIEPSSTREAKKLDLSHCKIRQFSQNIFTDFEKIKSLNLSNNYLAILKVDTFRDVLQLKSIDLSNNFLTAINAQVFQPLKELRSLDLSKNALALYDAEADFLLSSNIKILDVSGNTFVDLGRIFTLSNLNSLRADHNNVNFLDVPTKFDGTYLSISHNKGLHLGKNAFIGKKNLISLNLSYNKLKLIPTNLFSENRKLKILDLSHNEIQTIEDGTFQTNTELQFLDLSKNKLELATNTLFNSTQKLLHLDLSSNNIGKLGILIFRSLPELVYLNLADNKLKALHSTLFSKNRKLNILKLDKNQLKTFDHSQFNSNTELITLTLSQNEIIDFKQNLVYGLLKLSVLDLDRNNLTTADPGLTNLPLLRDLYMSCNSIATFDKEFFETNEDSWVAVRIHGNPLKCHCINYLISYRRRVNPMKNHFSDGKSVTCIYSDNMNDDCTKGELDPEDLANWVKSYNEATSICKRD